MAVQQLEVLVRTAIFKPANALVGLLLQGAADRIDVPAQAGPTTQGAGKPQVDGIFGSFKLERDYYYHEGKKQGHYPADAALGLEVSCTPALARLMCLEGADDPSHQLSTPDSADGATGGSGGPGLARAGGSARRQRRAHPVH